MRDDGPEREMISISRITKATFEQPPSLAERKLEGNFVRFNLPSDDVQDIPTFIGGGK